MLKIVNRILLGVGIFFCLIAVIAILNGCGGSSSGGNHSPLKAVCQACTYGDECESNLCIKFKSGIWRCAPQGVQPGYTCPSGMYKLPGLGDGDRCE